MRHQAIRNIYPNVILIKDDIGCFDKDNQIVEIDEKIVETEIDRLIQEDQKIEYIRKRVAAYPPLSDLADALYWQDNGDDSQIKEYFQKCKTVKNQYPKSE